jgi:hypothetical protein
MLKVIDNPLANFFDDVKGNYPPSEKFVRDCQKKPSGKILRGY